MSSFKKLWKSEQYRPEIHWKAMEESVKTLKEKLLPDDFERYFTVLQKFVAGVYPSESIERELSWLPGSLQKISETFVQKLIFCCNMETVTFEEYFDDEIPIEERLLPHPATINAKTVLHCLKHKLPCPEGDVGLLINYTLRCSMYDILEMALRTKKTYKLAENGLLKCFLNLSNNPNSATSLSPRDFFDSLAFYDNSSLNENIPLYLETSEAFCNFFDKMRRFSKFPSPVEE